MEYGHRGESGRAGLVPYRPNLGSGLDGCQPPNPPFIRPSSASAFPNDASWRQD
jgi:hypothetical protein